MIPIDLRINERPLLAAKVVTLHEYINVRSQDWKRGFPVLTFEIGDFFHNSLNHFHIACYTYHAMLISAQPVCHVECART